MKRSTTLLSWMKRIFSAWNLENIKIVKRVIVSVVGATVLLIGIALLVLPGPAFVVIPIGLAILATEYAWARGWLKKAHRIAGDLVSDRDHPASRDSDLALRRFAAGIKQTLVSVRLSRDRDWAER